MYASVLESTGTHRPIRPESYGLLPPASDRDPGLAGVWGAIENVLFSGVLEARPLTALYDHLRDRPFGLCDGIIPVLLCAVLLHHEDDIVLYEEGRFVTDLTTATFERMMKRPESY